MVVVVVMVVVAAGADGGGVVVVIVVIMAVAVIAIDVHGGRCWCCGSTGGCRGSRATARGACATIARTITFIIAANTTIVVTTSLTATATAATATTTAATITAATTPHKNIHDGSNNGSRVVDGIADVDGIDVVVVVVNGRKGEGFDLLRRLFNRLTDRLAEHHRFQPLQVSVGLRTR